MHCDTFKQDKFTAQWEGMGDVGSARYELMGGWISDSYCSLKPLCSGMRGSSAGSFLTDPTSPISSHCAVIILIKWDSPSAWIVVTSTAEDCVNITG